MQDRKLKIGNIVMWPEGLCDHNIPPLMGEVVQKIATYAGLDIEIMSHRTCCYSYLHNGYPIGLRVDSLGWKRHTATCTAHHSIWKTLADMLGEVQ